MARLEAHAREFFDLPMMQVPAVMDDYDTAAHNDLLYIDGLINALADEKSRLLQEIRDFQQEHGQLPSSPLMWLQFLAHSAEALPHKSWYFTEPWPEDRAAVLLGSWPSPIWEEGQAA